MQSYDVGDGTRDITLTLHESKFTISRIYAAKINSKLKMCKSPVLLFVVCLFVFYCPFYVTRIKR